MFPVAMLASPAVKYLSAALLIIAIVGGAYVKGRSDSTAIANGRIMAERVEWQAKVTQANYENALIVDGLIDDYTLQAEGLQLEIDNLTYNAANPLIVTKTVRVYIPAKVDKPVPKGFVDLHNTAADGRPLSTKQSPIAADASDKPLSSVGAVVAQNYYQCNKMRAQLTTLQGLVRAFQEQQRGLIE